LAALPASPPFRRLKKRAEFLYVRDGLSERRKSLVIQARKHDPSTAVPAFGVGFTATKKIGNAVIRNRAKRRLRAAVQRLLPLHGRPGVDYVFIARDATATVDWSRLLDDMESALISLARL
jgi:ribonuclease P protein component